ncbi:MAG TPA: PH domain-containing protein [Thermoplasmata archaeon]|nr:PH domain-containing protein [Thermoplasmata archaeon]
MAREFPLLKNEVVRSYQVPHPVAIFHLYAFCLLLLLWGVAISFIFSSYHWKNLSDSTSLLGSDSGFTILPFLVWLSFPFLLALLSFFKKKKEILIIFLFFLLTPLSLAVSGVVFDTLEQDVYQGFLSSYSLLSAVIALMVIDFFRRNVRYYFTNKRVVISKKIMVHTLYTIPYHTIISVSLLNTPIEKLFNVGTLFLRVKEEEKKKMHISLFFDGKRIGGIVDPEKMIGLFPVEKVIKS